MYVNLRQTNEKHNKFEIIHNLFGWLFSFLKQKNKNSNQFFIAKKEKSF